MATQAKMKELVERLEKELGRRRGRDTSHRRAAALVREIREQGRLSPVQFAQTLGVAVETVYRWEKGSVAPNKTCLQKLRQIVEGYGPEVESGFKRPVLPVTIGVYTWNEILVLQKQAERVFIFGAERFYEEQSDTFFERVQNRLTDRVSSGVLYYYVFPEGTDAERTFLRLQDRLRRDRLTSSEPPVVGPMVGLRLARSSKAPRDPFLFPAKLVVHEYPRVEGGRLAHGFLEVPVRADTLNRREAAREAAMISSLWVALEENVVGRWIETVCFPLRKIVDKERGSLDAAEVPADWQRWKEEGNLTVLR